MSGVFLTPYVSPTKSINLGSSLDFPKDWLPHDSSRSLRQVIHRLDMILTATINTVSTTAVQGEDLCGLCQHFNFGPARNPYWDHDGQELRAWMFDQLGNEAPEDPADTTVTTTATSYTYRFHLPLALPRMARRGKNFALPVDYFRSGDFMFRVQVATQTATLQQSAGASHSISSAGGVNVRFVAWVADEYSFEAKERWTSRVQATEADDRFPIEGIVGKPLISVFLHKAGVSGGASMANISQIDIPRLGFFQVPDEDLEYRYEQDMPGAIFEYSKNPFDAIETTDAAGAKAFPLIWAPVGSKITQLPQVGSPPEVVVGGTAITAKRIIKTFVTTQDDRAVADSAAKRGVDLGKLQVRTLDGKPMGTSDPYYHFLNKKVSGRAGAFRG